MWSWIIKVTLISLLLIFLLHYLYSFFKITLTAPKLKDLVNKPEAKYNTIYRSIQSTSDGGSLNLGDDEILPGNNNHNNKSKHHSNFSAGNTTSMKDELKKYLKEISTSTSTSTSTQGSGDLANLNINGNHKINDSGNTLNHNNFSSSINENIVNPHNELTSVYSPANIIGGVGANGVSTRVHNTPNFMADSTKSSSSFSPDFGTPNMSSSYSSSYSPY
jgi:hypothetical protein